MDEPTFGCDKGARPSIGRVLTSQQFREIAGRRHMAPFVNGSRLRHAVRMLTCLSLLAFGACIRQPVRFEPSKLISPPDPHYRLEGKALVLTDANEDQRIWSVAPQMFHLAPRLDVPFGLVVSGAATLAFGQLFTEGADWLHAPAQSELYTAVVRPTPVSFSYRYIEESGQTFTVMDVVVSVSVFDNDGNSLWKHTYSSGPFRSAPFGRQDASGASSTASPALHSTCYALMAQAAREFADQQLREIAPFVKPSTATQRPQ